jgi:hypothetical protein
MLLSCLASNSFSGTTNYFTLVAAVRVTVRLQLSDLAEFRLLPECLKVLPPP